MSHGRTGIGGMGGKNALARRLVTTAVVKAGDVLARITA
jgi:hypothetical protein